MKQTSIFLLFVSLLLGCQRLASPSDMQGTASDGVSYRWLEKTLSVCWENPEEETELMRKAVQDIVQKEYARAGFGFVGWKSCGKGDVGIRIRIADSQDRHVLAFGRRLDGMLNGMQLNLQFVETEFHGCNGPGVLRCVQEDALHEFGHALGLRHEQSRIDSFCSSDGTAGLGEGGAIPMTAYDKDSVMNYCANNQHSLVTLDDPQLSGLDVETLKAYYAGHDAIGRTSCEADGNIWYEDDLHSCCAVETNLNDFRARPYQACARNYQLELPLLTDENLEDYKGPWLNVELACRYDNFRAFAWDFYLEGDELELFLKEKKLMVSLLPAADLVCDGISLNNPEQPADFLKSSFELKPQLDNSHRLESIFTHSTGPAFENFPAKYLFFELPTLPFEPMSLTLSCDRNNFIGYFYSQTETTRVFSVEISFNADYLDKESLVCHELKAFDTEIPRFATESLIFPGFQQSFRLDRQDEWLKPVLAETETPDPISPEQNPQQRALFGNGTQ